MFEQGSAESARRSGGLGLGLTISRSIIEQHGGRLSAASEGPDRGSTFTVEIPTVPTAAEVPTIEPVESDAEPRRPADRFASSWSTTTTIRAELARPSC